MKEAAIAVEGVSHFFGEGELRRQVLSQVNAQVGRGEIIILMGPSGSGKTTLLTLMGALRSAQSGSLRVLGRELRGASEAELAAVRKRIGYVFQAHNLLEALTARQNVKLSLEPLDDLSHAAQQERAAEALEAVGLGERKDAHPSELSGGQRQRVAIARAIARRPEILLADEPTASLDRETGRNVVELIERLARKDGVTVVLVTHDNRILDVADRILALEDGRLTSVMSAVTVDTRRLVRTLGQEVRRGELVRRVQGMDEHAFVALLEGVTAETEHLLEVVNTLQSDAFVNTVGQLVDAFSSKLAGILSAERARILFLDEASDEPWSLDRCENGPYREVHFPSRDEPGAALPSGTTLRRPVQDSRGRTFAVVEVERGRAGAAFAASDERRLGELTASLGALLESWWRMGCGCRAGRVLRPLRRDGARPEDELRSG